MTTDARARPAALDAPTSAAAPGARASWHGVPVETVARELETGARGITGEEARRRLLRYGPNEVEPEREEPWWMLLLAQFRDPLIYILLIAAVVTMALGDYADTGVILAVVVINAIIGFWQEMRARQAMRALARLSAPQAEVIRDGAHRVVPSRELVPGDLVALTSGTRIPADLRLTLVRDLEVDESALTGESAAVRKTADVVEGERLVPGDQRNMSFAGTSVTRGRATGIVVRTGEATELGRIATAMRAVGQTATPLQETMVRFGRQVGLIVVGLALLVVVIGMLRGLSPAEIFITAVAMAVSAIPEGLPVVLTVTLAIGVRRMAKRNAIIRALPAVETLGSTTVIGSDKTGTLTRNEMTVRALWCGGEHFTVTGAGYGAAGVIERGGQPVDPVAEPVLTDCLLAAALANEADAEAFERGETTGDPTELALLAVAAKGGVTASVARARHRELDIIPFEPERRYMATLNAHDGSGRIHLKGAPEVILARCAHEATAQGIVPLDVERARAAAAAMAQRGLRVLAMAYRDTDAPALDDALVGEGCIFAGLAGMEDPVRPEAVTAVKDAHAAGIRVLMLTGDHASTATAIGAQLGLGGEREPAMEGQAIDGLDDAALDAAMRRTSVFARVAPEHKLRIVQRLNAQGEIVAVTGDGVNDAPALRAAHLGVAMGRGGTDVAREAADMVLADDNFATITAAVEEGRVVFANIRKVTFFLLSTAAGEILTILVAILAGWPLPFVAAQILWINLVTNGLQDVALAFEPGEPGLLHQPPRARREDVLSRRLLQRLGGVSVVLAAGTLGVFWWSWTTTGDLAMARTTAMTQMVVFQFFHVFNCRSLDRSVTAIPPFSNPFLFASILAALVAHLAVLHVPALQTVFRTTALDATQWGVIVAVGLTVVAGGELDKWWNRRRRRQLG